MVDARDLKSRVREDVRVQVPLPVPNSSSFQSEMGCFFVASGTAGRENCRNRKAKCCRVVRFSETEGKLSVPGSDFANGGEPVSPFVQLTREITEICSAMPSGSWGTAAWLMDCPVYEGKEHFRTMSEPLCWGSTERFRAASVIKTAAAACLFDMAQSGELDLNGTVEITPGQIVEGGTLCEAGAGRSFSWRELVRLSLIVSDNTAANAVAGKIGKVRLNEYISRTLGLHDTVFSRFFMHSPEEEGENFTTAPDCAKMLASLWSGDILKSGFKEEFWSIMSRQMFIEKLPSRLPAGVKNFNKTGELDDGARHDIGVFCTDSASWALAFLSDQTEVPSWQADEIAGRLSLAVFSAFVKDSFF